MSEIKPGDIVGEFEKALKKTGYIIANGHLSRCRCGHTGDGHNSDHEDFIQPGHGPCKKCDCPKFVWVGYIEEGGDH